MIWKGEDVARLGDLLTAITRIAEIEDEDERTKERDEFVAIYRDYLTVPEEDKDRVLASNIGYLSGYSSPEQGAKIRAVFEMAHPIFGTKTPESAAEALAAGAGLAHHQRQAQG